MKIDAWRAARRFLDEERARSASALVYGRELHRLKMARMGASSFAFLRGSARLFYDIVARNPSLLGTTDDVGWIVGDLHVENFGAFRTGSGDDVVFDVNDFDDAARGPRRLDLLRVTTSLLLAAPLFGFRGRAALDLTESLLRGYADGSAPRKRPPAPIARLLDRVRGRSRAELLARRTELHRGKRRFVRGERYFDLPARLQKLVPATFDEYLRSARLDPKHDEHEIVDVAFRIAGTGSLGALRIAVLTRGKGGRDGNWLFDLKEERRSACALALDPAKRRHVVEAIDACLQRPPIALGRSRIDGIALIGRRLAPQEDKLALATVKPDELPSIVPYLGGTVSKLHARSGKVARLSGRSIGRILDDAVVLAGVHESAHLALARMAGR